MISRISNAFGMLLLVAALIITNYELESGDALMFLDTAIVFNVVKSLVDLIWEGKT